LYKYGGILIGLDQSQRLGRTLGASLQLDWTTGLNVNPKIYRIIILVMVRG
jgi:hypothetical protein